MTKVYEIRLDAVVLLDDKRWPCTVGMLRAEFESAAPGDIVIPKLERPERDE